MAVRFWISTAGFATVNTGSRVVRVWFGLTGVKPVWQGVTSVKSITVQAD